MNGFNFHTYRHGKNKSTMNYGVCVSSTDGEDYFGILDDIIELEYTGPKHKYNTVVFKCNWMDCGRGMKMHEQYKIVELNHTKKYPKYEPFVLSYQVSQVYYASYPSLRRDRMQWWAVFKTQARSDVDAPVDEQVLQARIADKQSTLCPPNEILGYDRGDEFEGSESESESEFEDDVVMMSEHEDDDDESSVGSSDEDSDEDDVDVVLDDSSDEYSSDHSSDKSNDESSDESSD